MENGKIYCLIIGIPENYFDVFLNEMKATFCIFSSRLPTLSYRIDVTETDSFKR